MKQVIFGAVAGVAVVLSIREYQHLKQAHEIMKSKLWDQALVDLAKQQWATEEICALIKSGAYDGASIKQIFQDVQYLKAVAPEPEF
jgi:hypothetical protein